MQLNVSTLLQEAVGSRRDAVVVSERLARPELGWSAVVDGIVDLVRTQRGILVRATFHMSATAECSRCLDPVEIPVEVSFAEEFVTTRDPVTGLLLPDIDEDAFRIDERHLLDLSEAVRQYEETALPIQPLCRDAACAGLCPQCGANLNTGRCDCAIDDSQAGWEPLAALAAQLRHRDHAGELAEERTDGPSEA